MPMQRRPSGHACCRRPSCRCPRRRPSRRCTAWPIWKASSVRPSQSLSRLSQSARHVLDVLERRRVDADPARLSHAGRLDAGAHAHRAAGDVDGLRAVVDDAVAVVVLAVADLDAAVGRRARGLAAGHRRVAIVKARQARALRQTPSVQDDVRERERAGDVAAAAVDDVGHEVEAFVDRAVAVVVEAVAGLDAGVGPRALAAVRRDAVGVVEIGEAGIAALPGDARRVRVRHQARAEARAAVRDVRLSLGRVVVAGVTPPPVPPPPRCRRRCRRAAAGRRARRRRPAAASAVGRNRAAARRRVDRRRRRRTPPSGGITWTPKSQRRSLQPDANARRATNKTRLTKRG